MTKHMLTLVAPRWVVCLMSSTLLGAGLMTGSLVGAERATGQELVMPSAPEPQAAYGELKLPTEDVPIEDVEEIEPGRPTLATPPERYSPSDADFPPESVEYGPLPPGVSLPPGAVLEEPFCEQWEQYPLFTESSGTWLRRGWWYAEVDAVVLSRMWKRDDLVLAAETGVLNSVVFDLRNLQLNRNDPGADAAVRLTLGRFLFRDIDNRDHTFEFTAMTGGEWAQHDTASSENANSLLVSDSINHFNASFNGADTMRVDYSSNLNSFEWNYRVKGRMRRDRMELMPSGEWVRRANEGWSRTFLMGLRYVDLEDRLDWTATDITTQSNADGRYLITASNDLFGMQIGGSCLYDADRWSFEFGGKGGVYLNDVQTRSRLTYDGVAETGFPVGNRETTMSFVGEFSAVGRYHLRPNLSLRAGYQLLYLTSIGQAADQITFSPDEGRFAYTGDPFYHGALFGLEGYW